MQQKVGARVVIGFSVPKYKICEGLLLRVIIATWGIQCQAKWISFQAIHFAWHCMYDPNTNTIKPHHNRLISTELDSASRLIWVVTIDDVLVKLKVTWKSHYPL